MPGDGLITSVQPATIAGATLFSASVTGKFHGTIAATTPMGEPSTSVSLPICEGRLSVWTMPSASAA